MNLNSGAGSQKKIMFTTAIIMAVVLNLFIAVGANALTPDEVLVIANRNAARSPGLAEYYMRKRGIPGQNLLRLWLTDKEKCSRGDYEKKVAAPVRRYLNNPENRRIRCLVTMFGMPLKISSSEMTEKEKKEIKRLNHRKEEIEKEAAGEKSVEKEKIRKELEGIKEKLAVAKRFLDKGASLDSELALVKRKDYPLSMWIPNPCFVGFRRKKLQLEPDDVLMVGRLDGSSPEIVKRMIDDTIQAEEKGLKGTAYFDARWPDPGKKNLAGYAFYDGSIHLAAKNLEQSGIMPVITEETQNLFQPGECPAAALYCGWYKLAHYVDAFTWQKGAVGYHIASAECSTLKGKNSRVWCKMMLEKGIAATIGPVGEPYVQAFPVPEVFFGLLAGGHRSLGECYIVSTPYLSWKMVLIGDPLYKPFSKAR